MSDFHILCTLSRCADVGTYPDDQVDLFRDYVGADTAFVPMGGETCAVSAPRSECISAVAEMVKLHFSYINREFQADVLASWAPCRDEMEKRLGYRLRLLSAFACRRPFASASRNSLCERESKQPLRARSPSRAPRITSHAK